MFKIQSHKFDCIFYIKFDFSCKKLYHIFMEIIEEKSTSELMQSFKSIEDSNSDICTVILKVENKNFGNVIKPYEINLMGKSMLEWVKNAVYDTHICFADYIFNQDFLQTVKNATNSNCKYTLVLFSDAPLFQRKTFLQVMEYFKMKSLSVLKLTRGYVFETEYLMRIDSLLNPQIQYFDEEDFITCYNLKQTAMVREILRNRILDYLMKNGVMIEDPTSTFIDADCEIEEGTLIKPFNQILGQSVIEKNVTLNSHCVIENSVLMEGAKVSGGKIVNSFIGRNAVVDENCVISNNAKICDNVIVPKFCNIDGVVIEVKNKLKSFYSYKSEE